MVENDTMRRTRAGEMFKYKETIPYKMGGQGVITFKREKEGWRVKEMKYTRMKCMDRR